jgi:hypothetical protein
MESVQSEAETLGTLLSTATHRQQLYKWSADNLTKRKTRLRDLSRPLHNESLPINHPQQSTNHESTYQAHITTVHPHGKNNIDSRCQNHRQSHKLNVNISQAPQEEKAERREKGKQEQRSMSNLLPRLSLCNTVLRMLRYLTIHVNLELSLTLPPMYKQQQRLPLLIICEERRRLKKKKSKSPSKSL